MIEMPKGEVGWTTSDSDVAKGKCVHSCGKKEREKENVQSKKSKQLFSSFSYVGSGMAGLYVTPY